MPKHYNIDFKKSAVELIKTADISIFPFKTLENWITAYNKDPHVFDRDHVSPQQQIKKLEKQVRQQQETIDILKKAAAFFASQK